MNFIKKIIFFLLVFGVPQIALAAQLDTVVEPPLKLKLIIISGNQQSTTERQVAQPLVVKAINQNDDPITNTPINFSFQQAPKGSSGQVLSPASALTDAGGMAKTRVTFGDKFGSYQILARLQAEEQPSVVFSLTYHSSNPIVDIITSIKELITGKKPSAPGLISTFTKQPIAQILRTPIEKIEETKIVQMAPLAIYGLIILSSPFWLLELLNLIYYFFHRFLFLFGLRKKSKPWGMVYDSETKKPVELAIVRIFQIKTGKLLQTQVTDHKGRFGFLVNPGTYRITVSKYQYKFFSKKKDEAQTGPHEEVYYGGEIEVPDYQAVVKVNIPGDPKETLLTQVERPESLVKRIRVIVGEIAEALLWVGLVLSVLIVIFKPTFLNFAVLPFYGLPIGLSFFKKRNQPKTFGKVFDGENNRPLAKAQIRIFNPQNKRLLGLTLSDNLGRYGFVGIPAGKYVLIAMKDLYRFEGPKVKSTPGDEGMAGELVKVGADGVVAEPLPLRYIGETAPEAAAAKPASQPT